MQDLTEKQAKVADLAADGLTTQEIAKEMGISHSVAKGHILAVCRKLGITRKREIGRALRARQEQVS